MRLFIGIPLAPEAVNALERLSNSLRANDDDLRWSSPQTWHITLQFLGETSVEKYGCVVSHLREMRSPVVGIGISGTGFFDRAGVFFADVEVTPELRILEKQVIAATTQCGFVSEERPYHPHLTLARAKGNGRVRTLRKLKNRLKGGFEIPPFVATEFLLYESFPGQEGARHEVRERFPLG